MTSWRGSFADALHRLDSVAAGLLLFAIWSYQRLLSPLFTGSCRFYPSCSAYAAEAVRRFGALRGSWMAVRRLARCHQWHPGGHDPVSAPFSGAQKHVV